MAGTGAPRSSTRAPRAMVASADHLATQAGLAVVALGGNAVDAAIATNAAMGVVGPHLCGMGGDLFALIHDGARVHALNASGRAGSGASSASLRDDGMTEMPFRHDIRSVTVPGCVDGWTALHERFGRLPMSTIVAPAIALAADGFPASPLLVGSVARLDERSRGPLSELVTQALRPGDRVRRPGVAAALHAFATGGRDAFYLGPFGDGLLDLGDGWYDRSDLEQCGADWVVPLAVEAFGRILHTIPPNSQAYLVLGAALLAHGLEGDTTLPSDPDDPQWAHLLIEVAKAAGRDRPDVLSDAADGNALIAAIAERTAEIDPLTATSIGRNYATGDTTYLCTVDAERMGVSLIQSNASGFGSWLVEPNTGINLHNRGMGFSVQAGHPAEIAPGRRPPHTLSPALATHPDGALAAVFGTMGGDAQPQILLQLAARLFRHEQSPGVAIDAARWVLSGPETGFDTWTSAEGPHLLVEGHAPESWSADLANRGHDVRMVAPFDSEFGHAHAIVVDRRTDMLVGAADPRTRVGSVAGM